MKVTEIEAGERRRIIRVFSSSVATTYRFRAEPLEGTVSGTVEVKGSNWIFPKPAVSQELAEDNTVEKGAWDTLFSVTVVPDGDVRVITEGRSMRSAGVLAAIVGVIVVLAGIVILLGAL